MLTNEFYDEIVSITKEWGNIDHEIRNAKTFIKEAALQGKNSISILYRNFSMADNIKKLFALIGFTVYHIGQDDGRFGITISWEK